MTSQLSSARVVDILEHYASVKDWNAQAAIMEQFLSTTCGRGPLGREIHLELPLVYLRSGSVDEAIEAAADAAIVLPATKSLVNLFVRDVERGFTSVWARHKTFATAALEFGRSEWETTDIAR